MTKSVLCIIVGVVALAAYNTMMAAGDNDHNTPNRRVFQIANKESKFSQCLDFNPPLPYRGSYREIPAEIVPCSRDRVNQFWTLTSEGFIQSLSGNLCLTFDPLYVNNKNFVNVKDCDKSSLEAKKWKVWLDGSIAHAHTHQVLSASLAVPYPFVNLEENTHAPSQVWEFIY